VRHPAASQLADWRAGRLTGAAAARTAAHVEGCAGCAAKAARLATARQAMDAIRDEPAPELGWDHIAARIYWVTSSEKRRSARIGAAGRLRRSVRWAAVGALATATAVGAALLVGGDRPLLEPTAAAPVAVAVAAPAAESRPLVGVVTFVQGEVSIGGAPLELDRPLGPGDLVATGDGRVTVQFGRGSGFTVGPGSRLALAGFDARSIELVLEAGGAEAAGLDVEVSQRAADQRFVVTAGARQVEVRGTRFSVEHGGERLAVACHHGAVVVRDGSGELAVAAGQAIALEPGALIAGAVPRPIDPARLAALERAASMPLLPAWTDAGALFQTSTALEVSAAPGVPVVIDGLAVGDGSFQLRVMSGRHQLAAGDAEPSWIDAPAGPRPAPLTIDLQARAREAAADDAAARRLRRGQLAARLDHSRAARQCLRSLEKQGLVEGSHATFEVAIDGAGAKLHVNVVASNLPPHIERCLRDVVDDAALPAGPAATVRYRMSF
jgi:hypothetical protein